MKILLIGEGHGFDSLVRGFTNSSFEVSILDNKRNMVNIGNINKIEYTLNQEIAKKYKLIISSGYRNLVSNELVSNNKFLNIHYALFPKYRGMHSIVWAILNGEKQIGITLHIMDSGLDSGPIVWQHFINIENKTSWQLMLECDEVIENRICEIISNYVAGELIEKTQDHSLATYVGKRNLEDCRVNWSTWSATFFERALKALVPPYPRPFFDHDGKRYQITKAKIIHRDYIEINGHIVYVTESSILIKIYGGLVEIFELSMNSENSLPVKNFFNKPGIRFL
jgi:methionyl-tRNA formyltransferase